MRKIMAGIILPLAFLGNNVCAGDLVPPSASGTSQTIDSISQAMDVTDKIGSTALASVELTAEITGDRLGAKVMGDLGGYLGGSIDAANIATAWAKDGLGGAVAEVGQVVLERGAERIASAAAGGPVGAIGMAVGSVFQSIPIDADGRTVGDAVTDRHWAMYGESINNLIQFGELDPLADNSKYLREQRRRALENMQSSNAAAERQRAYQRSMSSLADTDSTGFWSPGTSILFGAMLEGVMVDRWSDRNSGSPAATDGVNSQEWAPASNPATRWCERGWPRYTSTGEQLCGAPQ
jgi:hypothetical protein